MIAWGVLKISCGTGSPGAKEILHFRGNTPDKRINTLPVLSSIPGTTLDRKSQ